MTNAQIILNQSINLMEQGIIGSTGRMLTFDKEDGSSEQIPEPEPIHTYAAWKSLGFQVSRGQKACASFQIWKHKNPGKKKDKKTGEEIETEEKMFMTNAFFFRRDQVEPLEPVKE